MLTYIVVEYYSYIKHIIYIKYRKLAWAFGMLKGLMPKGSFWLMVNLFLDCTQVEKKDSTTTGKVLSVYLLMGMILCKDPCKKFWLQPCSLSLAKGVFFFSKCLSLRTQHFYSRKLDVMSHHHQTRTTVTVCIRLDICDIFGESSAKVPRRIAQMGFSAFLIVISQQSLWS